jgi:hypothetical protein
LKLYGLLLAGILTCTSVFAATDPFIGTWVYNAEKSPKPTIKYGIKDLGGERYSLTGSTGVTVEVKADGVSIKTPTTPARARKSGSLPASPGVRNGNRCDL